MKVISKRQQLIHPNNYFKSVFVSVALEDRRGNKGRG